MKLKRYVPLALALAMTLALFAGCKPKEPDPTPTPKPDPTPTVETTPTPEPTATPSLEQDEKVRVGMLKGATGLGAAYMMDNNPVMMNCMEGGSPWGPKYEFTLMAEPTEAVAALTKGEVDIAALPTNVAATLYHKLDGGIQLLALNTYGVLYILERGESVKSLGDLSGKTVHAFGQGANPEFVLNYLLAQNGLEDVTVQWHASTDEVSTLLASGEIDCAMLPVPAATAAVIQGEGVRMAIDLTREWKDAGADGVLTMGCVVARREFVEHSPEAVEQFLTDYEASITFMSDPDNLDQAAVLAETYGIIPKAAMAKKALPDANLCFVTGDDMMTGIQGYYQVLYKADPASIGGSIPDEAFYYLPKNG